MTDKDEKDLAVQIAEQTQISKSIAQDVSESAEMLKEIKAEVFGREDYPGLRGRMEAAEASIEQQAVSDRKKWTVFVGMVVALFSAIVNYFIPGDK